MTINKLAIIGGSGLYDVEEFKNRELLDLFLIIQKRVFYLEISPP